MGRAPSPWPDQPIILEINTWVWLAELSRAEGLAVDLGSIPSDAWDSVLLPGVDAVWLMGVWSRSPAGSVIARQEPGVRAELEAALPDLSDDDIVGSPYSVRAYTVDARLGGDAGLAIARAALAARGIKLLVDYVPNHVARDHSWVTAHPEYLVRVPPGDRDRDPDHWIAVGDEHVALGRDPYFPPWTDVVQLNAFSQPLRDATARTLTDIAGRADGVRCDMAMLLLNDVFARTWGALVGSPPPQEFWPPVIAAVKQSAPDFLFVAEAYWDLEQRLLDDGFDYCYDKRLYDRIVARDAAGLHRHLTAEPSYQRRMVRFLENHDEPRSATLFDPVVARTTAVALATLPGALLLYEGQAEGRAARPPVQLGRRPDEAPDADLRAFYDRLLRAVADAGVRGGAWALLDVEPVPGGASSDGLAAWSWEREGATHLVVVNLADHDCEGRVRVGAGFAGADDDAGELVVAELLSDDRYRHDAGDVAASGLYVNLAAGAFHLLRVLPSGGTV